MTFPLVPLRRAARILNGGTPPSGVTEFWDGEVPFVTPPDLNGLDGAPLESTARTITAGGVAHSGLAPTGSVLLSTRAPIGHIGRLTSPAAFNQGCRALVPVSNQDARFLAYALVAARADMDARGLGTTFLELSGSSLAQVDVPLAPLEEQRAIADYLDRETAQIDAFIAKNEELIALLTERRSAATFRLVTGLDVTEVQSKAVNADWFRAVPQTWDVAPLYTMAKTFAGGTPKSDEEEYWTDDDVNSVEWIAIGDMRAVQAGRPHSGRRVTGAGLEGAALRPRSGPLVLFAMYASVGEVAMLRRPAVWNQAILGIQTNPSRLNERYLYWTLLALRPRLGIYFRSNTQDNLNAAQVRGLRLPVPPLDEQRAIADQLEETWASVDEAIATAQRSVQLAQERRGALISAAVTGKIDVGLTV